MCQHECKITTEWRHLFAIGMTTQGTLRKWATSPLFDEHLITLVAQYVEPQIIKSEKLKRATHIVAIGDSLISSHSNPYSIRLFSLKTRQFVKELSIYTDKIWTDGKLLYLYNCESILVYDTDLVQQSSFPAPFDMYKALHIGCHNNKIYYDNPAGCLFAYNHDHNREVVDKDVSTIILCDMHLYVIKGTDLVKMLPDNKTINTKYSQYGRPIASYTTDTVITRETQDKYSLARADTLQPYPCSINLHHGDRGHILFTSGLRVFIYLMYQNMVCVFDNPFGFPEN